MSRFAFAIGVSQERVSKWDPTYEENVVLTLKTLGIQARPWHVNVNVIRAWWEEAGRIIDPEYVVKKVRALGKVIPREHICQLALAVQGTLGNNHPLYKLAGQQLHIHPTKYPINETQLWLDVHKVDENFSAVVHEFQRLAEQITLLATLQKAAQDGRDLQVHKHNPAAAEEKWSKVIKLTDEMATRLAPKYSYPSV